MRNRSSRFVGSVAALLALFAMSIAMFGQATKQTAAPTSQAAAAKPDLTGVWSLLGDRVPGMKPFEGGTFTRELPPMTPNGQRLFDYNRNPDDPLANGRAELNPGVQCMPVGPAAIWSYTRTSGSYFEIFQSDKRVLIVYEYDHWIRQIWTDGREHPKDVELSWMGDSIGKWEGDTLVVDTIKIHDESWINEAGHPHSEDLHMTERIKRPTHDSLQIDFTFDDPKIYTKPWTGRVMGKLQPDGELEEKVVCEERWLNKIHSY